MLRHRLLFWASALFLMLPLLTGCSKDQALGVYNAAIEAAGARVLAQELGGAGELDRSQDGYTGSYVASPVSLTGQEFLFGGTSIDKSADSAVTVACAISAQAGSVRLFYQLGSAEPDILLDGPGTYAGTLPTPPGSCYIGLEYDGFSGTVALSVS